MILAIDGPAASGKSTVARAVARRLGWGYLDTGAMYRAIAAEALRVGVPLDDEDELGALAGRVKIGFVSDRVDPVPFAITVDGRDVTEEIRSPETDDAVSPVALVAGVRAALVDEQRRLAASGDIVVEGRDIGTVVFPNAPVKVYLTASPHERARRRLGDRAAAGHEADIAEVARNIASRDEIDSQRAVSPLSVADDAHVVDTTELTVDHVVHLIAALVAEASC
jgi:cytidylate kinase